MYTCQSLCDFIHHAMVYVNSPPYNNSALLYAELELFLLSCNMIFLLIGVRRFDDNQRLDTQEESE